jgi:hypothetical protein
LGYTAESLQEFTGWALAKVNTTLAALAAAKPWTRSRTKPKHPPSWAKRICIERGRVLRTPVPLRARLGAVERGRLASRTPVGHPGFRAPSGVRRKVSALMIDHNNPPEPELVTIAQLVRDEAIQPRVDTDSATVIKYREAMRGGASFRAIHVVESPAGERLLVDGWHRIEAAEREGFTKLYAHVWIGSREDAIEFAAQCNARHGLPRNEDDLRKVVTMLRALPKWRQASNVEIAKHVNVSEATVRRLSSSRDEDAGQPIEKARPPSETRRIVRRGGREYPMETRRIGVVEPNTKPDLRKEPEMPPTKPRFVAGTVLAGYIVDIVTFVRRNRIDFTALIIMLIDHAQIKNAEALDQIEEAIAAMRSRKLIATAALDSEAAGQEMSSETEGYL